MNNIYILLISNEESEDDFYFTTLEKAQEFIKNNYQYDEPRELFNDYFEGKKNRYLISDRMVNQEKI